MNFVYFIFVIAISFGGNIHIIGITPRQVSAVIMFFITIANYKLLKPYYKIFILLYFGYLFIALISAYFDDYAPTYIRSLLSQHFVAMSSLGAFIVYYHNKGTFTPIVYAFLFCGILNMSACLLQYVRHPMGYSIGYLFIEEDDYTANRHMEMLMDGSGFGYLLGMRGNAVHNGYFMVIMPFLLTYLHLDFKNKHVLVSIEKWFYYILLAAFFITILLIQERSCILLSFLLFALYLKRVYTRLNSSKKALCIFATIALICGLLYILPIIQQYLEVSRFSTQDNDLRMNLLHNTFTFISNHFLLGGWQTFVNQNSHPPHNIFLNSFVEAGFCGFILATRLYCRQLKFAYQLLNNNFSLLIFAFLACSLNALLHNDSILTGDVLVWTLWGMVMCLNKQVSNYNRNNAKY